MTGAKALVLAIGLRSNLDTREAVLAQRQERELALASRRREEQQNKNRPRD